MLINNLNNNKYFKLKDFLKLMPEKNPISNKIKISKKFEEHYRELLKQDYQKFIEYSFSYLRRSIRINTLKIDKEIELKRLKNKLTLTQIPWCEEGYWVNDKDNQRFDFGNLLDHQLGYFYLQESASMIPAVVLEPKENMRVLDMCAAPGSKTSQIAQYMKNTGVLIANDLNFSRLKALGSNLQRLGVMNSIITNLSGNYFNNPEFDRVLVDAPCSGTGTIRKSYKVLDMWSPGLIKKFSSIQKKLILSGFDALKTGGVMVYSTCTLEPEENEFVVDWLLKNRTNAKLLNINLKINRSKPILEWKSTKLNTEISKVLRIHPQDNDSEGFFVAKITKL